jgi:ribosomal protein S12 methylthiotransferase accessory factor
MRFEKLCANYGGVLTFPRAHAMASFSDRIFHSYMCTAGNLTALSPHARSSSGEPLWHSKMSGSGTDLDDDLARLKAVCEAAERYSSCILLEEEFIVTSADELGGRAFDWRRLPRFSAEELAHPYRQVCEFKPAEPMRWIQSWNMLEGRMQYVPVVMSHLYPRSWSTERFWLPISTGTAVHTDPAAALVTAIAEVVERDSIALTWLMQRELRRITFGKKELDVFSPALQELLRNAEEYQLFDGTTDFGLPTVYLRRHRPGHPHAVNLVSCACDLDYAAAVFKAVREIASLSSILDLGVMPVPTAPDQCFTIEDGAIYMAQPQQAHAFGFLDGTLTVPFSLLRQRQPLPVDASPAQQLRWMVQRTQELGFALYAVELTCDELQEVNLRSFRAIMPDLMPMSTVTNARYLGSARLQQFHRWMQRTGEVLTGSPLTINPNPQAFA